MSAPGHVVLFASSDVFLVGSNDESVLMLAVATMVMWLPCRIPRATIDGYWPPTSTTPTELSKVAFFGG